MISLSSLLLDFATLEVFWRISAFCELHEVDEFGVSELFLLLFDELLPGGESSFILVGDTYAEALEFAVVVNWFVTDLVMPSLVLLFKSSSDTGDNKSNAFIPHASSVCSRCVFEFSFLSCLFSTLVCNRRSFLADRKSSRMEGAESSSSLASMLSEGCK